MNRYQSEAELYTFLSTSEGDAGGGGTGGGGFIPLMFSLAILVLFLSSGCSFKSDDKEPSQEVSNSSGLEIPKIADTDRDGLSDNVEAQLGRDQLTGNFPIFEVVDFSETSIEITDFTNPENKHKATYKIDQSIGNDLSFSPLSDKLAKHSYTRTVGQTERPEAVDVYDLNTIKLSNFLYVDTLKIRNFIKENEENLDSTSVRIQSRFYIRASSILGLTKINNIKAELGFLGSDGGFDSFGSVFDLMTTTNTRLIFTSRGDSDSSKSNMEALIYIDRLPIDTITYILENDLQLALKITDYTASIVDGSSYKFSTQVQEALSNGTLYSVSTPSKDYLFFNARQEPIGRMIERLFGDIETDGEGTLLSTTYFENNSSYPIRYEELGNEHLKQKSWHLFSENDKTTDTPNVGESVMLGFFSNSHIAKMGGRTIRLDRKEHNTKKIEHEVNALNIGEVIEIRISGSDYTQSPSTLRSMAVSYSQYTCICSGRHCKSSENKCREPGTYEGQCSIDWIDLNTSSVNLIAVENINQVFFTSQKIKNPISLSNIAFFKKQIPIRDINNGEWLIKIVVDQKFLDEFGNSIKVNASHDQNLFSYGHMGWGNCPVNSREFGLKDPALGVRHQTDSAPTRNYNISIKRSFTR